MRADGLRRAYLPGLASAVGAAGGAPVSVGMAAVAVGYCFVGVRMTAVGVRMPVGVVANSLAAVGPFSTVKSTGEGETGTPTTPLYGSDTTISRHSFTTAPLQTLYLT